jgi:hypothetical protein
MANPTTNFGWVMPTSTDLVTDLPADFNTFGQAVDTSMADLKGGTTGQILSKATNTDMDFTWITNDQGDITAVNTTAPLAGGGTSGALTLSIAAATTSVAGAVQLSDSTATTSSVLAATPTAVKSAYDLADGAIAKSTVTTAGDIIYRNATVPTRLGLGTAGQVLTVNTGATAPEWKTPAGGGGKVLQVVSTTYSTATTIASTSMTDTGITLSITPTLSSSKILVLMSVVSQIQRNSSNAGGSAQLMRGASAILSYTGNDTGWQFNSALGATNVYDRGSFSIVYLDNPATTSSTTYKLQGRSEVTSNSGQIIFQPDSSPSTITLMEIGA